MGSWWWKMIQTAVAVLWAPLCAAGTGIGRMYASCGPDEQTAVDFEGWGVQIQKKTPTLNIGTAEWDQKASACERIQCQWNRRERRRGWESNDRSAKKNRVSFQVFGSFVSTRLFFVFQNFESFSDRFWTGGRVTGWTKSKKCNMSVGFFSLWWHWSDGGWLSWRTILERDWEISSSSWDRQWPEPAPSMAVRAARRRRRRRRCWATNGRPPWG